jgi:PPOX class probable F420-dependent enzyme
MTPDEALALVASHRLGVLVTLRGNGRPQTSNVVYAVRDRQILISLTEDRAKTRNLRRDPRATLHVSTGDMSQWAAVEATAELSPVTRQPGDATGRALAELYRDIAGQE